MSIKKLSFIGLFIYFFLLTFNVTGQDVRPVEGFRNIEWGMSVDEIKLEAEDDPIFNLVQEYSNIKVYTTVEDDHTVGTVNLDEILYYFHDEAGFFKFVLSGNSDQNEEMDALLKNRFGNNFNNYIHEPHSHMIWDINGVIVNYREQVSEDFVLTVISDQIQKFRSEQNQNIDDF